METTQAARCVRATAAVSVSIGGDIRLQEEALFAGPGGSLEQFGLYLVDAGQHIEHRLFVDHNAPHTNSNVDYRGALQGQGAHSVWIGDVLIRAEALGTDTFEVNRNLVLTDGARADSVPNLEIETGEIVGAGHASATGRFDDEQLFYLLSRGIPEPVARRLVVAPHRDGGQAQYTRRPVPETHTGNPIGDVIDWALEHLDETLTIEPGETVEVLDIRGATAYVHPVPRLEP